MNIQVEFPMDVLNLVAVQEDRVVAMGDVGRRRRHYFLSDTSVSYGTSKYCVLLRSTTLLLPVLLPVIVE